MSFFRRLAECASPKRPVERLRPRQSEAEVPGSVPGIRAEVKGDTAMVTVDLDEFGSATRPLLLEELAHSSGLPIFDGTVEHGYAMRSVGSQLQCPCCNAATRQHMAHFIYATDIAPRVIFAPAG